MIVAIDTSVSVPLLHRGHPEHRPVTAWARGQELALAGHAEIETYSVLTRLPGDSRLAASDAERLLRDRFEQTVQMADETRRSLLEMLGERSVAGGAVYDALVALAARDAGVRLGTRDGRARNTYTAIGVDVVVVP